MSAQTIIEYLESDHLRLHALLDETEGVIDRPRVSARPTVAFFTRTGG